MNGLFYKVVYRDNHGEAFWIGRAFDKYDAIRKSKAEHSNVIYAGLFDEYEKNNPVDKVNVRKQVTKSTGWLFNEDLDL